MQLEHDFTVPVPPAQAWEVLLDLERVAPCMPGATLDSVDGDDFTGKVKVKVGPITVVYQGKGSITERDDAAYRAVIEAAGRETRGSGTASATVTATLTPHGADATKVLVVTDLAITGKPAQFGRGVMSEVGAKLIGMFADCLADKITAPQQQPASDDAPSAVEPVAEAATAAAPTGASAPGGQVLSASSSPDDDAPSASSAPDGDGPSDTAPAATSTVRRTYVRPPQQTEEPAAIDLLDVAGASVVKRAVPAVGALAGLVALVLWLRRRR